MARSIAVRVGIVGSGCNADYHFRYSRACPDAQTVGIVEENGCEAAIWVNKYENSRRFLTPIDLAGQEKLHLPHIVSAPTTHFRFGFAREAIESGCHVIVESPLALNSEDAASLFELAGRRAIKLCATYEYLFKPCVMRARDVIKSGCLGDVAQVEYYRDIDPHMPNMAAVYRYQPQRRLRSSRRSTKCVRR